MSVRGRASIDESAQKGESRSTITILVLGDDGVGKSSLISTFVSRHFSEVVPGLMTRVRLPPEPDSNRLTTIVDSQSGDTALIAAVAKRSMTTPASEHSLSSLLQKATSTNLDQTTVSSASTSSSYLEHVDSIILVYDLDRVETFYRLENHWLPLIERCYNGELPVIVAGNKMDLMRPATDEQSLVRSRQQLVSLLQRFRFVRQCIKCSAKNLLRVNEVFIKAQQAVLYPFAPLFDLNTSRLTTECRKALTRIFRMYDQDHDGLLSNAELDAFQYQTFRVPLMERDLAGWKKVVARNTEEQVVKDGKFTVAGFLAIFDVFISQNRMDVPWRVLRKFGYNDNLNLTIPAEEKRRGWKLSSSARHFLVALFHQFDSDHDGKLSSEDLLAVFSILPEPALPPWHPARARTVLKDCFSTPKPPPSSSDVAPPKATSDPMALSLTASGVTVLSGTSLPSVGDLTTSSSTTVAPQGPMTLMEWMGHWHMIAAISPSAARAELYRLGHIAFDSPKRKKRRRAVPIKYPMLPSEEIRLFVMGSRDCDKPSLIRLLCGQDEEDVTTTEAEQPETWCTHMLIKRKSENKDEEEEAVIHFIITQVPEEKTAAAESSELKSLIENKNQRPILVVFCFDGDKESSLSYTMGVEKEMLHDEIPRVFVAVKGDDSTTSSVMATAEDHCHGLDLEAPLTIHQKQDRKVVLRHMAGCVLEDGGVERVKSMPHAEQKKREAARRRKMIWLGSIVSVSMAVAIGVGVLWSSVGKGGEERKAAGRFRWFTQMIFFGSNEATETK